MTRRLIDFGSLQGQVADLTVIHHLPKPPEMKTLTSKFLLSRNLEIQVQMTSSTSNTCNLSPSFLCLRRRIRNLSFFTSPSYLRTSKLLRLSASLTQLSWIPPPHTDDYYNGWAIVELESPPPHRSDKKKGLPRAVIGAAVGSSVVLLLAVIAYFALSTKGFKLQFGSSLNALNEILNLNEIKPHERKTVESGETDGYNVGSTGPECVLDDNSEAVASGSRDRLEHVILSVAVDSTQQEALSLLKKLKIIEDDIKADELCTRREYARWLVHVNSLLERSPKHRIVPSISLSGSLVAAFDDVGVQDPDFESIQALAEAGIVPSKLLGRNSGSDGSKGQVGVYFSPERFISRQDLASWKAQVEYEFKADILKQISTKVGYMDVKEIRSDASPELFMDLLAGDKSIVRKVFGQSKRFQPNKPSTKAQAAVALTSGRMAEAIYTELSRLEAESSSRQAEMEEIRRDLLDRGDIKKSWDEKFDEERTRAFKAEKLYESACLDLEQELNVKEKCYADELKEKAAMDCQRQLLLNLKEEVEEMSERLSSERAMCMHEKCKVRDALSELLAKLEGLRDTKSILEAEKEALRILRSWVEDEAKKSQARAKVLEEVGRRWRWNSNA